MVCVCLGMNPFVKLHPKNTYFKNEKNPSKLGLSLSE